MRLVKKRVATMQALIKIKAVVLSQESQSSSPESEGSQQFADENQKSENF